MDTNIKPGNFRLATFSGVDSNGVPVPQFDAPPSVSFSPEGVCAYATVDGNTGDFVALSEGTTNFAAAATYNGFTATVTGVITVVKAATGFTLSVSFGDEQPTPAAP